MPNTHVYVSEMLSSSMEMSREFLAVQDFPDDPQARVSTQALIGFSIPVTRATTGLSIFRPHNAETNPTPSALSGLSPSRNPAPHLLLHPDTEALFTPDMHRLLRAWSSPVAKFPQTPGKIPIVRRLPIFSQGIFRPETCRV